MDQKYSKKQCEVMALISQGLKPIEITERLKIKMSTFNAHLTRIAKKQPKALLDYMEKESA